MRTAVAFAGSLLLVLLAPAAPAKDVPAQNALADAKALHAKGDVLGAAARFGTAAHLAQSEGDLETEQEVVEALAEIVEGLPEDAAAPAGATSATATRSAVLAAVLRKLDPQRAGAFVSGPCLARTLLESATRTGDTSAVADAAKVAAVHATRKSAGRAGPVVGRYATGMSAVAAGKHADATAPLQAAVDDAAKNGWTDLATHAATELAVAWTKAGDAPNASAAVAAALGALGEDVPQGTLNAWGRMLAARLPDAPDVAKPVRDRAAAMRSRSVGAAGGRGGRGADAGADPKSPIAKLLPTLARTAPIVQATRRADGFHVRWATSKEEPTATFSDGVTYADDGGVWIAVHGRGVGLQTLDWKGTRGGPGGRPAQNPVRALYLVAEGETWTVAKDGSVAVSPAK